METKFTSLSAVAMETKFKYMVLYVTVQKFWWLPMQILVPIANGTEEMEATMIIDILRRAKANVVVASLEDKLEVVASRKVKMVADVMLDDALKQQYDLILLPVSRTDQFSLNK